MIYPYIVLVIVVAAAAVGFQRGWLRDIATLGGILVAWLCVTTVGGILVGLVNRVILIVRFTIGGGFDLATPNLLLDQLRRSPLVDPRRPETFLGILFLALVAVAYVMASQYAPLSIAASGRALGVLVGLVNGYLVSYVGLRYLAPEARTGLSLTLFPGTIADELGRYLPTILIAGVVVTIAIALLGSRKGGGRGNSRVSAGRARG